MVDSEKNGLEEFVYHYRVAGDGPGTYSCVPRLSFGGREFAAEPYVVTVKPASAAVSFGRWWLYVPVGALLALWGAVFVRDHTVALRGRFSRNNRTSGAPHPHRSRPAAAPCGRAGGRT